MPPGAEVEYRKRARETALSQQLFKPENMARGMMMLYPELAREIALSLMNDAIMIGESKRAWLWWDVLVRIGRIEEEEERARIH